MPDMAPPPAGSPQDLSPLLEEGQQEHRAGNLQAAEERYLEALALAPEDFVTLHLLGVVKNQRGDFAGALEFLDRALERNPRSALAHLHRGNALWGLGRTQEALSHFQHCLRLNPEQADALLNSAAALSRLDRHAEALQRLDRLLALQPGSAAALMNRGAVLEKLGRLQEALASHDQALALSPDWPDALCNRGNTLLLLERYAEALASYERTLALDPGHPEALENRDNPLLHSGIAVQDRLAQLSRTEPGAGQAKRVLFLLPPYMTGKDGECGDHPLESDLHYHFEQSFINLNYHIVKPKWNHHDRRIFIDMDDLSRLLEEDSFTCCILEVNFETSEEMVSSVWYQNAALVEKLKTRVECIITFIGDAYPRGKIVEVIETAHRLSTVVWCPYQGTRGMLQLYGRPDLIEKIDTTPSLPTVFSESVYTRFPEDRAFEISYIGSSKRLRLNAVAEFCRLDNVKMFVNTTTRDFNSLNNSKPMKYFLDILDNSLATITSTARTPDPMGTGFEGIQAKYPEVFSGRFAEAVSRGCMPIYIARDGQDHPPLPNLQQGLHYYRVEQVHEYNITLRALRSLDRQATVRALRDYHAAYLSPQALLAPLLERDPRARGGA